MASRSDQAALLATALVALALVSGCASSPAKPPFTVSSQGNATVPATPDKVTMTFTVTKKGPDAKSALASMSRAADALMRAVQGARIAKKDIRTTSLNVSPVQKYPPNKPPVTVAYQAVESVMITSRDLPMIGDVIAAATSAGATVDSGPTFSISPDAAATGQALAAAVDNARAGADAMAKAAGRTRGRALTIAEQSFQVPPPQYLGAAGMPDVVHGAGWALKVAPGQEQVEANVTVVYELR
jgi:uncharacterized protein YggE